RSFGSVLTAALGSISGFNAEMSSVSVSGAGTAAVAVFLPKILESNVAILQFSLQRCALRVRDADTPAITSFTIRLDAKFMICACPAEFIFFDQYVLNGT